MSGLNVDGAPYPNEYLNLQELEGIQLDFRIEITGNLDETEDEAEVSAFNISIP
ncbi:MAG: hypothetical protein RDU01_03045 [Thermodesulfovibrionales bacterium]|nr:hypothetical protein [Thermodesulfovibrionales bacterium]